MSMPKSRDEFTVPTETARVAHAVFPQGHPYLTLRDELGDIYSDDDFGELFSTRGQPAEAPGCLAMVIVLQFAEGLTDRQAADAVRSRLDWKYLLGLDLTDPGFDFSVLSEFRQRLLKGKVEMRLLDHLLAQFKTKGLLKAGGQQRTDSTHVLDAVRELNRLELVGETLRHALNDLAAVVPAWLTAQVTPIWFERYAQRFEAYRLPKSETARNALLLTVGTDGYHLLRCVYSDPAMATLRTAPAVEVLRRVWVQNYHPENGQVQWRQAGNLPAAAQMIASPYDVDTHYSHKRETYWTGYKVHLTETCDPAVPHFITHVQTTPATTADVEMTEPVHQALAAKDLLPQDHLLDTAYGDAHLLVTSATEHHVNLIGRVLPDHSWQAKQQQGFDATHFQIDWEAQRLTCPQGKLSCTWSPSHNEQGGEVIHIRFGGADCRECACRAQCTQSKTGPRSLKLHVRAEQNALQMARVRQKTDSFKAQYAKRAGVEGTLSQGVRAFNLRRSRYIGLTKTHLQHVAIATAINLKRFDDWITDSLSTRRTHSRFAALAVAR